LDYLKRQPAIVPPLISWKSLSLHIDDEYHRKLKALNLVNSRNRDGIRPPHHVIRTGVIPGLSKLLHEVQKFAKTTGGVDAQVDCFHVLQDTTEDSKVLHDAVWKLGVS